MKLLPLLRGLSAQQGQAGVQCGDHDQDAEKEEFVCVFHGWIF
jgi:hypothetical protein